MKKRIITTIMAAMIVISATACASTDTATTTTRVHNKVSQSVVSEIDSYIKSEVTTTAPMDGEYLYESESTTAAWENASESFDQDFNTEEYNTIKESGFESVRKNPLSTFAADVDTGSYCNLRRLIRDGWDLNNVSSAIRTEEILNYFEYDVENKDDVFSVQYSVGDCPWNAKNKVLLLTMQANSETNVPNEGNNFVFLVDTSGSMSDPDKLELAKKSFKLLAGTLGPKDRVSIVTYAGSSETLLEGSSDYEEICRVLDGLSAYGGTNGSGGITAAYDCATKNLIKGGNNRVIIASDGDMNLGITSQSGLVDLIKEKKETGVFLTVLGFGTGNYSDANMESIADAGNGNYYYIDGEEEAERVLCEKMKQTTVTVAKDVKFQVEFNPAVVSSYRQIGYENRQMSSQDFNDDTKDGGEIGAGAQVTVCYELVMTGSEGDTGDGLKYQDAALTDKAKSGEVCTVSVRYKAPDEDKSSLIEYPLEDKGVSNQEDFHFACGIIEASMVLRNSEFKSDATMDSAYQLARKGCKNNRYREQFCDLLVKLGADS